MQNYSDATLPLGKTKQSAKRKAILISVLLEYMVLQQY